MDAATVIAQSSISQPLMTFFGGLHRMVSLDGVIQKLISRSLSTEPSLEDLLKPATLDPLNPFALIGLLTPRAPNPALEMKDHEELLAQMMVCKMVDTFLLYVSDLLCLIFKTKPDMMKSKEDKVSIEYITQYKSMDELIHALVEDRVRRLSFKSLRDLDKHLTKNYALSVSDEDTMNHLALIVEIRNLLVHNRGIINRAFVEHMPQFASKLGQEISIGYSNIYSYLSFLSARAEDLDRRAIKAFGLPLWQTPEELVKLAEAYVADKANISVAAASSPQP